MVEEYKDCLLLSVLEFLRCNPSSDFYLTEQNTRIPIRNENSLKKLLKISKDVRILQEKGDIVGIILVWKSEGQVPRNYLKIHALNEDVADRLLTVTLWNTKYDLWIKIRKMSKFLKVFQRKGFQFRGDRGQEILLSYNKNRVFNGHNKSENKELVGGRPN